MFAVAAFLSASADVARTLQVFLIPFQKDFIQRNVLLNEALGCRLLLPRCLLPDEDSTGNDEDQDGWNVSKFHRLSAVFVLSLEAAGIAADQHAHHGGEIKRSSHAGGHAHHPGQRQHRADVSKTNGGEADEGVIVKC